MHTVKELQSQLAQAKQRIQDLEKRSDEHLIFLEIFNSSPVPLGFSDEDGKNVTLNNAFTSVYGYTVNDIPTLADWWPIAYPDKKYREWVITKWVGSLEHSIETHTDFEPFEVIIQCKDGSKRSVLTGAAVLTLSHSNMYLVVLYDITEIQQANNKIGDLSSSLAQIKASFEAQNVELIREKENAIANEERLRYAMLGANDGLWDWDIANDKMYFSPRWKSMLGYKEDEIEDSFDTWQALLHPDDVKMSVATIDRFFERKIDKYEVEFRMQHKNKHYVNILSRAFALESEEGKITRLVGTHVDITERKESDAKLQYLSSHDSLTGLVNRREFERRLEQLLVKNRKQNLQHALCYLDLDQFKVVNDTCGHAAGDELLRQLSANLKNIMRQGDTLARLGGDEFGVLMSNCSLHEALQITTQIQNTIQDYQFLWESSSFRLAASIGLVQINTKTPNLSELFKYADVACYVAKDRGRNRIHVHSDDDAELTQRQGEMQWVNRLQHALDENRFCLYAQAIEALNNNKGKHFELLVRMLDEQGMIIPPGAFLPAAERYNIVGQLDRWVLKSAVESLNAHSQFLEEANLISINLSGQSLTDEYFLDFVKVELQKLGKNSNKICFEITETSAISNLVLAGNFISELKQFGCCFALDDFGSGLSSFAYLKNLAVDFLKIDGAFVRDIVDDPIDHAMVKSINEIGQVMGMKTIAEFVENTQIKEMLRNIGVDYAQGYGVHMPQPFTDLLKAVAHNKPQGKI